MEGSNIRKMILKRVKIRILDDLETNCYIIEDEESKETIVIDPGGEADKIIEVLEILESNVKYIYLTHCHGDHIGAVHEIYEKYHPQVLIHRFDEAGLRNDNINLSSYIGQGCVSIDYAVRVDEGDIIHIGNMEFRVIHTPGHTIGSSSLYSKKEGMLFSGDTIFRGTWGRTDLPTGSLKDIMNSIMQKILKLPDKTIIYPGHGKSSMIREERPIYEELKPRSDL